MKNLKAGTIALACGLLLAVDARADSDVLAPYHADYTLARNSLTLGVSHFSLVQDGGGRYTYTSNSETTGLAALFAGDVTVTQRSQFELKDGRPRSLGYSYVQTGKDKKSDSIQFDWSKLVAQGEDDGHKRKNPLTPEVSDVFLIQLILAADAASGKLADGYKLLDHGSITSYTLHKLPDQKMKVGKAQVDATVLELKEPTKGRAITVWLAPTFHYLPLQIQQTEPGKATITLSLDDIAFGSPAPAAATTKK